MGIREYKNDISLNDEQIATVVKWVDQGAQQGNPADMPPAADVRIRERLVHRRSRI